VNPHALESLQANGISTDGLRSKSWDEFATPGAPQMDFIFTVCDKAAAEQCPIWPGKPISAHWGIEDPAAFQGPEERVRAKFRAVLSHLSRRIELFLALPMKSLEEPSLRDELSRIGRT
jgi:arsenate reductase (thioredoxin)